MDAVSHRYYSRFIWINPKNLEEKVWRNGNLTKYWQDALQTIFADNQIVLTDEHDDVEYMTWKHIQKYNKFELKVNITKTKNMCEEGEHQQDKLKKDGCKLRHCKEYRDLGIKETLDEVIKDITEQGRTGISIVNWILWNRNYQNLMKKKNRILLKSIIKYSNWNLLQKEL